MRDGFWTKERIALLKRLWRQGKTAAAIGAELGGLSRAAVLGKIFRLRLAPAKQAAAKNSETAEREKRKRGKALMARPDVPRRRRAAKAKPSDKARRRKASKPKTLLELTNDCCRWPYERAGHRNYFFCGAAGADLARGIPYCPEHMRRAYLVPPCIVAPAPTLLSRAA
jgi:GcrA cell cycle regulator